MTWSTLHGTWSTLQWPLPISPFFLHHHFLHLRDRPLPMNLNNEQRWPALPATSCWCWQPTEDILIIGKNVVIAHKKWKLGSNVVVTCVCVIRVSNLQCMWCPKVHNLDKQNILLPFCPGLPLTIVLHSTYIWG